MALPSSPMPSEVPSSPSQTNRSTRSRPASYISTGPVSDVVSSHGEREPVTPVSPTNRVPISGARVSQRPSTSSSRPTTSQSRVRTHVPFAAQGFLRPLSSQKLQAKRHRPISVSSGSPSTATPPQPLPPPEDGQSDGAGLEQGSEISSSTFRNTGGYLNEDVVPSLRGGELTDPATVSAFNNNNYSSIRNMPARSLADNVRLLQERSQNDDPSRAPLQQAATGNIQQPYSLDVRLAKQQHHEHTRERLSSASSREPNMESKYNQRSNPDLGKNFEYFTGNNIFFLGGRFLNSRDKPVNILTAIFFILPTGLFYGYSWVSCYFPFDYIGADVYLDRAPWLWHHVSPAIPIVFAYVFLVCLSSFIHASVVDPGVSIIDPPFEESQLTFPDYAS